MLFAESFLFAVMAVWFFSAGGGPLTTETTTAGRVAAVATGAAADPRGTAGDGEERYAIPTIPSDIHL